LIWFPRDHHFQWTNEMNAKKKKYEPQRPLPPNGARRPSRLPVLNEERRRAILDLLSRQGRVLVTELSRHFETSQVTIRRDLESCTLMDGPPHSRRRASLS